MTPPSGFTPARADALAPRDTRDLVLRAAALLAHTAELARVGAESRPNHAARYILDTISDLRADLSRLRRHLRGSDPAAP